MTGTVKATIYSLGLVVEALIDDVAPEINAFLNEVAFAIQASGTIRSVLRLGTLGGLIKTLVNGLAAPVQAIVDPVAAFVESFFDKVTALIQAILGPVPSVVRQHWLADQHCQSYSPNGIFVHDHLLLRPLFSSM
tara:strand:- start:8605 stop:9009 length:405 start_codon:yes stop_codon:yes gene_type:complete